MRRRGKHNLNRLSKIFPVVINSVSILFFDLLPAFAGQQVESLETGPTWAHVQNIGRFPGQKKQFKSLHHPKKSSNTKTPETDA